MYKNFQKRRKTRKITTERQKTVKIPIKMSQNRQTRRKIIENHLKCRRMEKKVPNQENSVKNVGKRRKY